MTQPPNRKPFDPAQFNRQIAIDDAIRNTMIGVAVLAGAVALLLPGAAVLSGVVAPGVVLGLWLWWTISSVQTGRALTKMAALIVSDPAQAEQQLEQALRARPTMRWARLLSYHRLAGLRHMQRRFTETTAICLCLLNQPLKGPAAATRPHLLLMLAEAQLELGNLPGAYHALAHLQQTRLSLAQSLQRLAIQTRYELTIGAHDAALHRARAKVELAELMPAKHGAAMHAMLATAAQHAGQTQQADWLWQRTRLLAPRPMMDHLEQGRLQISIAEFTVPAISHA